MAAKSAKGKVKKVVLAYSGGLDTSIILKWLQETYRRRGGHLHRRPRPGRGAGAGAQEGRDARHQEGQHLHRGPARGVRARLRVPDVPRQRALRGRLPARHLDRPAADRQEADRDRAADRRRRRLSRRHRQGQRPGALRARLLRAGALDQDHRAVARVGLQEPRAADRVRREAPDPGRQGQARRGAVLGRRQPAALLLRGQGAGGSGRSSRRPTSISAPSRRWRRPTRRPTSPSASPRAMPSASTARSCRRRRCWPSSTTSAATTASAASTWSRTASSA